MSSFPHVRLLSQYLGIFWPAVRDFSAREQTLDGFLLSNVRSYVPRLSTQPVWVGVPCVNAFCGHWLLPSTDVSHTKVMDRATEFSDTLIYFLPAGPVSSR